MCKTGQIITQHTMNKKKAKSTYVKPDLAVTAMLLSDIMAGSGVYNQLQPQSQTTPDRIMEGDTNAGNLNEGDGSDANAKGFNFGTNVGGTWGTNWSD